jgi:hypothetical protein
MADQVVVLAIPQALAAKVQVPELLDKAKMAPRLLEVKELQAVVVVQVLPVLETKVAQE